MSDKKSSESRRKLLKSIAAGSGAIVAGKSLPESWSRPIVDSVMLPAHAQTSPTPPAATYEFVCSEFVVRTGVTCGPDEISYGVSGEVAASDGSSLEGVSLTVYYINGLNPTPPNNATTTETVLVAAGNTFSSGVIRATPPSGFDWENPDGVVAIGFTDRATYGDSSCTTRYSCGSIVFP